MTKGLFAGSFDPFTKGHADIVVRGLALFDTLLVAVGHNGQKGSGWIPVEERVRALQEFYKDEPRIEIGSYCGLTVDYALQKGVHAMLRSVRSVRDYEFEQEIAQTNRVLSGIDTVVLFADPALASLSSSMVRELVHYGKSLEQWIPEGLQYQIPQKEK